MRKYDLGCLLKSYEACGIISFDDALAGKETAVNKILKEKHQYEIYFSEAKQVWETYIPTDNGRKRIQRKNREDLEKYLLNYYKENKEQKPTATFESLYNEFMDYKFSGLRAGTTKKEYMNSYRKYYKDDPIIKRPLGDITKPELEMWLVQHVRAENMDKKKFHKFSVVFSQLYVYAKYKRIVKENLFDYIDKNDLHLRNTEKKKSEVKAFNKAEAKSVNLIAYNDFQTKNDCVPLAVMYIFQTGIRVGEAVALKWDDIDFEKQTMTVQRLERMYPNANDYKKYSGGNTYEIEESTKGRYGARTVDLSEDAVQILEMLKSYYDKANIQSEWIFARKNGKIHYKPLATKIRNYCRTAGIPEKSLHKVRATYISCLRDAGMSFEKIAEEVGHKQVQTTMNSYSFDVATNEENRRYINTALKF